MAYLTFAPDYFGTSAVTVAEVTDWERLAFLYDSLQAEVIPPATSAAETYVVGGQASLRVKGFLDGMERQMDMFR